MKVATPFPVRYYHVEPDSRLRRSTNSGVAMHKKQKAETAARKIEPSVRLLTEAEIVELKAEMKASSEWMRKRLLVLYRQNKK